jgi:lipopolysaccharide/colanic/teichoic acid biosynthesis glycosyltransferase
VPHYRIDRPVDPRRSPRTPVRQLVTCVDVLAILVGWAVAFGMAVSHGRPHIGVRIITAQTLTIVGAGLLLLSVNGLYRRRLCAVRSAEIARIGRTSLVLAIVTAVMLASTGRETALLAGLMGGLTWFALLTAERGFFREWIHVRRAGGDFRAPVMIVGGGTTSTLALASLLDRHLLLGFDVRGVVCPAGGAMQQAAEEVELPWLGPPGDLVEQARRSGASGLVVDASSLSGDEVSDMVQQLAPTGLHLHISSGLRNIENRDVTLVPLADETMLHVAPLGLNRRQLVAKRAMDVGLGVLALVVLSPVLLLSALLVWAHDRGPVLSRQKRIGLDGEPFTLFRFRSLALGPDGTPIEDAGAKVCTEPATAARDARLTPFGRFLRASDLDDLAQLLNVLEGTMSLVGPRPALPAEVAPLDRQLNARLTVKPGATGLWRVETRDLAGYDVHRRLDLVYVQTWSSALDLTIIARTAAILGSRVLQALVPTRLRSVQPPVRRPFE